MSKTLMAIILAALFMIPSSASCVKDGEKTPILEYQGEHLDFKASEVRNIKATSKYIKSVLSWKGVPQNWTVKIEKDFSLTVTAPSKDKTGALGGEIRIEALGKDGSNIVASVPVAIGNKYELAHIIAVFVGDSITEFWYDKHPSFFKDNNFDPQGRGGETTANMKARIQKAISTNAEVFVFCGGTNDIAGNGGIVSDQSILANITYMCEEAKKNGMKVALCAIPPCNYYSWKPALRPGERIKKVNESLKQLVQDKGYDAYVDYHTPFAEPDLSYNPQFTDDGCHPNSKGYDELEKIILPVIQGMAYK